MHLDIPVIRKSVVSPWVLLTLMSVMCIPAASAGGERHTQGFGPVQKLLDVSGLAWVRDDTFLAVHDAKFPGENQRTRVSLIHLPRTLDGLQWKPLRVRFPGRKSSDLESASRVPGTNNVLLVESGDDGNTLDNIYLARVDQGAVQIIDATEWSTFYKAHRHNIEATAVAPTRNGFLFIWAERAQGKSSTLVRWTDMQLHPLRIGQSEEVGEARFALTNELAALYNRPLVGLDLTPDGTIYGVAARDSDLDDGPWRSAIMEIGTFDGATIVLNKPAVVGELDGFKIESVAIRPSDDGPEVFFGTDDENYGGTLRQMFLKDD